MIDEEIKAGIKTIDAPSEPNAGRRDDSFLGHPFCVKPSFYTGKSGDVIEYPNGSWRDRLVGITIHYLQKRFG